ncbi:MAG: type 4a pilus biogenesis protein PilO [Gemmatimonadetes bacterium]|nr:type 4a pilus biogenesis protein PilO [Gemmatimonadota bacterium]
MALPPLDPQQKKNLMYGGVFLALLAFGFYDRLYTPRSARISEMQARLEALETVNSRSRALTRGAEGQIDQQLVLYRQQLELAEGLIPSAEEVPNLLDAISAEAQRAGVRIHLIQPVSATEENFFTRRVYDMAVTGGYHQIGEFLTRVASLPRIVTPTNLTVAPVAQTGGAGAAPAARATELEARFSIETYVIPTAAADDDASA